MGGGDGGGSEMGIRGVCREVGPRERRVGTEKVDQSWDPGEALVTTPLVGRNGLTTLTQNILYESREARDTALKTPMEKGVVASYDRLAKMLASGSAG